MSPDKIFFFAILPVPLWLTINLIVIVFRHRKAVAKMNQFSNDRFDLIKKKVEIRYYWRSREKDYISFITHCDIYFHKDYFILTPYQNFPFKAFHSPIVFKSRTALKNQDFPFSNTYQIQKLELNKFNRKEIELHYGEGHHTYRIKFKNVYKTGVEELETMKTYC